MAPGKRDNEADRPAGRTPRRVLVVDADRPSRVLTAQMLAGLGFRVGLADNEPEALQSIADAGSKFHAVLIDAAWDDATDLATRMRDLQSGLRVILVGDESGAGDAAAYFEFLPKRFTGEQAAKLLGSST